MSAEQPTEARAAIARLRVTKSYALWKRIDDLFAASRVAGLIKVYHEIDSRHGFKSQTNAANSWEALRQFLVDTGVSADLIQSLVSMDADQLDDWFTELVGGKVKVGKSDCICSCNH